MKSKLLTIFYVVMCFFLIVTCILFIINLIIGKKSEQIEEQNKKEEKYVIEYKANQTIRVKFHKTGEIIAMDVNDYLRGVVPSEMSPKYNIEALKAQALVARTYLYSKMEDSSEGNDADICDDSNHCQAYYPKDKLFEIWRNKGYDEDTINEFWYKVNLAVTSTQNEIITYNGKLIRAYFHASSPIRTEDISQIWGNESVPYLISVENKEAEDYENRTSTVNIKFEEFLNTLKREVKNIKISNYYVKAEDLRIIFGLKSTNFTIDKTDDEIIFNVLGYGHGVGMSQVGASTYADDGMKYDEIIKHYYTGVQIDKLESTNENEGEDTNEN